MCKSMDDRSRKELRFRVLILGFPPVLGLESQISGLPRIPAPRPSATHPASSAFCLTEDMTYPTQSGFLSNKGHLLYVCHDSWGF